MSTEGASSDQTQRVRPEREDFGPAARRWLEQLRGWAIPDEILAAAPESPWGFPPELFRPPPSEGDQGDQGADVSRRRALEVLETGDVVLDVGVGGGAASLRLCPPAAAVVGVDQSEEMLALLREEAARRGVDVTPVLGSWPEVAAQVPVADLVVCHHVFYNVGNLPAFALALTAHAQKRVVVEITASHPMASFAPLWRHFWGLERPSGPTAEDALAVLRECGIYARAEPSERPARWQPADRAQAVAFVRRRLCLSADRDPEVESMLGVGPFLPRSVVTLWW